MLAEYPKTRKPLRSHKARSLSPHPITSPSLLPVDLDIVHPATGELEEVKEDQGDGGYVSIKRESEGLDLAPVTQLKVHSIPGMPEGSRFRFKFNSGGRYKMFSDSARTQEVVSEQNEFYVQDSTALLFYFQGEKKSQSRGGEEITMQVKINDEWHDGDSVKCTIVEAVFDVWLNIFIPNEWIDIPVLPVPHPVHFDIVSLFPGVLPPSPIFRRKINGGDGREVNSSYSRAIDERENTGLSVRSHQRVQLIPYQDLSTSGVVTDSCKTRANSTFLYLKSGSVVDPDSPPSIDNTLTNNPIVIQEAENDNADAFGERLDRDDFKVKYRFHGSADNLTVNPSAAIDWDLQFQITTENPLMPALVLLGDQHDQYPAYELYARALESEDNGVECYKFDPRDDDRSFLWLVPLFLNEYPIQGRKRTFITP